MRVHRNVLRGQQVRHLVLALLAACSSPTSQSPLEQRVLAATEAGWSAAGLPEPGERCYLDWFEVRFPDVAEFDRLCAPGTTATANGCFRWLRVERSGLRETISRPVAVIDPTLPAASIVEDLAAHELFHGLVYCTLKRDRLDPYDASHSDKRVWVTATQVAQESLR